MEKKDYTIFMVDDDQMFLKAFSRKVQNSTNVTVKSFSNAEDCLAAIEEKPDMIITDFYLANGREDRMNGDQLLKKVNASNYNIPVMVMSAQEQSAFVLDLLQMGAVDYIDKNTKTLEDSLFWISKMIMKMKKEYYQKEQS